MKKILENLKKALIITAIIFTLITAISCTKQSDAKAVNLYNKEYTKIDRFTDDEYIISIDDGKSVVVTRRNGGDPMYYGWSHVDSIELN